MGKLWKLKNRGIKDWTDVNVSVIVSTGRTGTKFIAEQFRRIPGISAEHEPTPNCEIEGYGYLRGDLTENELVSFLRSARKDVRKKLHRKKEYCYIESNGGLIFLIPVLKQVFPNLRVAHIIRDPRDFVRSACSRVYYSTETGKMVQAYLFEDKWKLKSSQLKSDLYCGRWREMNMPERFMWMWNLKNEYVQKLENENDYIRSFRFEDIFFNEKQSIDFTEFVSFGEVRGLSLLSRRTAYSDLNKTKKFYFPHYKDWGKEEIDKLSEHCGRLMKIYGYC